MSPTTTNKTSVYANWIKKNSELYEANQTLTISLLIKFP